MDALICDTTPRHAHFHFLTSWDVFALICPCGVYVHLCWIFSHPCLAFFCIFPSVLASDFFPSFWFYRFLFFWISFSLVPVYLLIHCVETSCWLLEEGISAIPQVLLLLLLIWLFLLPAKVLVGQATSSLLVGSRLLPSESSH